MLKLWNTRIFSPESGGRKSFWTRPESQWEKWPLWISGNVPTTTEECAWNRKGGSIMYHVEYLRQKERQEALLSRKNEKSVFYNGIYNCWKIQFSQEIMCRCTGGTPESGDQSLFSGTIGGQCRVQRRSHLSGQQVLSGRPRGGQWPEKLFCCGGEQKRHWWPIPGSMLPQQIWNACWIMPFRRPRIRCVVQIACASGVISLIWKDVRRFLCAVASNKKRQPDKDAPTVVFLIEGHL